jgi:phospholipid/cholesterol/gamma-HCH transport system ATP-binding protein
MEPIIELIDIYKSFGDKHVLQGINFKIFEGETFVVLGPSGCGKSVTLKIMTGLLTPDAGQCMVQHENITECSEAKLNEIRKNMGMLFQNAALFDSLTVGENVAFSLRQDATFSEAEVQDRIRSNLARVGLPGTEDKMPSELSGGMRKRVGLARAIVRHPRIIFYDEPTTGLDPIVATEIDQLVVKLQKDLQVTSVVITHDLKSAFRVADRVALHYDGKLWEIATPEEFQESVNPMVQQFIKGEVHGPMN